jgi:HK97 family phage portal protein
MRLPFGFTLSRARPGATRGGWVPAAVVRDPYPGAWQNNDELAGPSALLNPIVFTCVDLIAREIGKMRLRLLERDGLGIWHEVSNSAYSPVLRKPNRYQTTQKFIESWLLSKLVHGNAYALKQRDIRGVVNALYVLDPCKVTVLIASDGAVYYELVRDELSSDAITRAPVVDLPDRIVVPASEIIHDVMIALYHPLIGVSPIYACAATAAQGLAASENQSAFFANGGRPSGILTAPQGIGDEQIAKLKKAWQEGFSGPNVGKVAILGADMKYQTLTTNAADSQLIEQYRLGAETICGCYHVPLYMVNQGQAPGGLDSESLVQLFYSQCLQSLVTAIETCLDEGLELAPSLGTEFDIDDLIWMNTDVRTKAAADAIGAGALSPNEARAKYYGLGPVVGGASPMVQQQYYSLAALAERDRDQPFVKAPTGPAGAPAVPLAAREPDGATPATKALEVDAGAFLAVFHQALGVAA